MVYITAIHMASGGTGHEHIASLRWRKPTDASTGEWTKAAMVVWIEKGGVAKVRSTTDVAVAVVEATPKYLRTQANGNWTDNLLALPRF